MTATLDCPTSPMPSAPVPLPVEVVTEPLDPRTSPILWLARSLEPEIPAYVPSLLEHPAVQSLIRETHPSLEYARQHDRAQQVTVHVFRDRDTGTYSVVYERASGQHTVKESTDRRPLWQQIVALVAMWEGAGRPA